MLALGEAIARKAAYGQQLGIRSARRAGASWAQIGAALGISKQSAWEAHTRWIDEQADQHGQSGHEGFDTEDEAAARALAGDLDDESDDWTHRQLFALVAQLCAGRRGPRLR